MATLDQRRESLDPGLTRRRGADRRRAATRSGRRPAAARRRLHEGLPVRAASRRARRSSVLSGGERGRLMLARALAKPSNLLVLDEPTNDLDLETLDVLEEMLGDYAGTVLLVSHDRDFLDRVVTAVLVPEGDGRWVEYAGGYTDMLAQRGADLARSRRAPKRGAGARGPQPRSPRAPRSSKRKLSFNEKHALETLPERIATLQASVRELQDQLDDPDLYARDRAGVRRRHRRRWRAAQARARRGRGAMAGARDPARGDRGRNSFASRAGPAPHPAGGDTRQTTRFFVDKRRGVRRGVPSIGAWGGSPTRVATFPRARLPSTRGTQGGGSGGRLASLAAAGADQAALPPLRGRPHRLGDRRLDPAGGAVLAGVPPDRLDLPAGRHRASCSTSSTCCSGRWRASPPTACRACSC